LSRSFLVGTVIEVSLSVLLHRCGKVIVKTGRLNAVLLHGSI